MYDCKVPDQPCSIDSHGNLVPTERLAALLLGESFPRVLGLQKRTPAFSVPWLTPAYEAQDWDRTPGRCITHPSVCPVGHTVSLHRTG